MNMTTCCEHLSDPAKIDKFCDVTPNIHASFKHLSFHFLHEKVYLLLSEDNFAYAL